MKLGLTQRTAQHLTLTPQLQQSIRLLQLSDLELSQEIAQYLAQNPFLESTREDDATPDEDTPPDDERTELGPDEAEGVGEQALVELQVDTDWQVNDESPVFDSSTPWDSEEPRAGQIDETPHHGDADAPWQARDTHDLDLPFTASSQEGEDPVQWQVAPTTLHEHLREQAMGLHLAGLQRAAVLFVIEHLNDDGWLTEPLDALVDDFVPYARPAANEVGDALEQALECVQQMDPPGVGATDLVSCLRLQLWDRLSQQAPPQANPERAQEQVKCIGLALGVLRQPLAWLVKRDYRQLAKSCGSTEEAIRHACDLIRRLEPRPGRAFGSDCAPVIRPDVLVKSQGSRYVAALAPHVRSGLRVNDRMVKVLQTDKAARADSLQEALLEARWLVKSLGQRCDTLLNVSQTIVDHQQAFFAKGPLHLKPMVLREVADELGLHESTVSRITTAKYITGPQGTLELKYFFTSGLASGDGQSTSSTAVRTLILQWVAAENPKKPLSDQKLSALLAEKGIDCARRTVTKYRESLKIAPTHLRRID